MWASLTKHWFLASLAICFSLGFTFAEQLRPLLEMTGLRNAIVFVVMWAMGVTLRAETIRRSLARPFPSLLAIAINVAVVPLLCVPWMWLLPEGLFGGLFVTSIVPCTLASASVWTRKAGGDDSIAMMTTVVTNLACVIIVPLGIWLVLSQQAEIDAVAQVKKLALLVVLPLILAQVMRRLGAAAWADRNRLRLSHGGQMGILAMVVFGAVASATSASGGDPQGLHPLDRRGRRAGGGDHRSLFVAVPGHRRGPRGESWARQSDCDWDCRKPENADGRPADRDRLWGQRGSDDRVSPEPVGDRHDRRRSLEAGES